MSGFRYRPPRKFKCGATLQKMDYTHACRDFRHYIIRFPDRPATTRFAYSTALKVIRDYANS